VFDQNGDLQTPARDITTSLVNSKPIYSRHISGGT
jgi:hypothetical protein